MTEIREPTVEEQIAERLRYWDGYDIDGQTKEEKYASIIKFILAIPEIKEGQELRRRELAKSRGKCPCLCHTGEPVFHAPACCNQANKPLASGESG